MMKSRALCAILAMVLVFSAAATAFAAPNDKAVVEAVVSKVKLKLKIDDSFGEFSYSVSQGTATTYSLNWRKQGDMGEAFINVDADENGNILNFYSYDYGKDSGSYYNRQLKAIPKLTMGEVTAVAEAFLKSAAPEILPNIKLKNINADKTVSLDYEVSANGIVVPERYVSVQIDPASAKVTSFYQGGFPLLSDLPDPAKAVPAEDAVKAFRELDGLRLIYMKKYGDSGAPEVRLAYSARPLKINALTGREFIPELIPADAAAQNEKGTMGADSAYYSAAARDVAEFQLSQKELDEIAKMDNLISEKEAEKIIRELPFGKITGDYAVTYKYLDSQPGGADFGQGKYRWVLSFEKRNGEAGYAKVCIDAETGRLYDYSIDSYMPYYRDAGAKGYTKEDVEKARAEAEAVLKGYAPDYFAKTAWLSLNGEYEQIFNRYVEMSFARAENGIPFPEEGFRITYDPESKTILRYSFSWTEGASFTDPSKAAPADRAFEEIVKTNPFSLQYSILYGAKPGLVYAFKNGYASYDAVTLEPFYPEYKYPGADPLKGYGDISGHFAEGKIKALAMLRIGFEGESFEPYKTMTQRDFLYLLRQCFEGGYYPLYGFDAASGAYDQDLYKEMESRGILKNGEKEPDSEVTREAAAVFITRALGHGALTAVPDLFAQGFTDMASCSPEARGAVSVIKALNIASGNGGEFMPKRRISRGEAAVMLYNMLSAGNK